MNIILEPSTQHAVAFNFAHLQQFLAQIPDPRSNLGKIYPLPVVLTFILLAKLAGCDKPYSIYNWVRRRKDNLLSLFDFHHDRVPCLNTYRTIMSEVIDIEALEKAFNLYLHKTYGGQESQLISIDGKTMRGTIPKGETQGLHLLAAYLPEEGIVLGQVPVDKKENEITAADELLDRLPVKNRVVCADAMQTQRKLSVKVLSHGGNYLWFAKENQPTLRGDIQQFFKPPRTARGWHIRPLPRTVATEKCKGHGRLEIRQLTLMEDKECFLEWPGAKQVFMLERKVICLKTNQESLETVFGLTSLSAEATTAEELLKWTRLYWGIENGLHYRRDVTLKEDETRFSLPKMAQTMAAINNFVIGLTQKLGYPNLAEARRIFDYDIASQLFT